MDDRPIRLLQANIAGAKAMERSLADRVEALAKLVERLAVDVLVVQAGLDANGAPTPITAIQARLPAFHLIAHAGLAILSRVPIEHDRTLKLTGLDTPEDSRDRHLLVARLPEQRVKLAVAHVSWVPEQAVRNVAEIIEALADGMADEGGTLLIGDFNQPPGSAPIDALVSAGFADAWARLNPGDPGYSFEIGARSTRIDYVFERSATPRVASIGLLATEPGEAVSDHALLLAELAR